MYVTDIDLLGPSPDHFIPVVSFALVQQSAATAIDRRRNIFDRKKLHDQVRVADFLADFDSLPDVPWPVDPHSHAAIVTQQLQGLLAEHFPCSRGPPDKPHVSTATAAIGKQRQQVLRRSQVDLRGIRKAISRAFFIVWEQAVFAQSQSRVVARLNSISRSVAAIFISRAGHLKYIAASLRPLVRSLRDDRQDYLSKVAADVNQAEEVWKAVQPLRQGTGRKGSSLVRPAPALQDSAGNLLYDSQARSQRIFEHFSQVESGRPIAPIDLLKDTFGRQKRQLHSLPVPSSSTLASRQELEDAFRTSKDGGFGEDCIPNSVYKLAPDAFARKLHPLALKVTALAIEPLSFKGGMLFQLYKGSGAHSLATSFRGILLVDCLGKNIRKIIRGKLLTQGQDYFLDSQRGSLPRRGTDQASHAVRLFLEWCTLKLHTGAVLFVDAVSAFYSVVRGLVMDLDVSDGAIAYLFSSLSMPPAAIHELAAKLQEQPILAGLDVHPHLHRQVAEMHQNTWFSVQGIQPIAQTERGSKPGDPFGDVVFNFLMARIVRGISADLEQAGIGFKFDVPVDVLGIPPCTESAPDVSYVDDLALKILPPSPQAALPQLAVAIGIVVDGFGSHGIRVNLKPNKTEAIVSYNGKGSKAVSKAFFRRLEDPLPFSSRIFGPLLLRFVQVHPHLGGRIHHRNCMVPEVMFRAASSVSKDLPVRKTIFRNRALHHRTRVMLASSLLLSGLRFNCGIWSSFNARATTVFGHRYVSIFRGPTGLVNSQDRHATNSDVLAAADVNSPVEFIAAERLRYYWRAVHHGQRSVLALVAALDDTRRSWTMLMRDDIAWFSAFVGPKDDFPMDNELLTVNSFLHATSNTKWKATINRLAKKMRLYRRIDVSVKRFHDDFMGTALHAGLPAYIVQPPRVTEFSCQLCDFACFSLQGLNAHKKAKHGVLHPANAFIIGSRCRACLVEFHSRNRALRHAKAAKRCLPVLQAWYRPAPLAPVVRRKSGGYNVAEHTPSLRACGPLLPRPWSQHLRRPPLAPAAKAKAKAKAVVQAKAKAQPPATALSVVDQIVAPPAPAPSPLPDAAVDLPGLPADFRHFVKSEIFILHLFAGRRRPGDLQHQIEACLDSSPIRVIVLSLDIVYGPKGDLTDPQNLGFWRHRIRTGLVIAVVAGPPCETWSTARFVDGGPPPLRSRDAPWAKPGLSIFQLRQLDLSNRLLHVAILFTLDVLVAGGAAVLEHPALTSLHELHLAPSIWLLPYIQVLLAHTHVRTCSFDQCSLGAPARKPTTLLSVRLPWLEDSIATFSDPSRVPSRVLIGRDSTGNFRTAPAKEYPADMCKAVAGALRSFVCSHSAPSATAPLLDLLDDEDTAAFFVPLDPYHSVSIGGDCALHSLT